MGRAVHSSVEKYVLDSSGPYNVARVGGSGGRRSRCIGIVELDRAERPALVTRLELALDDLFVEGDLPSVSGFVRLRENCSPAFVREQDVTAELACVVGVSVSGEDLRYVTAEVDLTLTALMAGSVLTGTLSGRLPAGFPAAGGEPLIIDVLGARGSFGRFRAAFTHDDGVVSYEVAISDEEWRREFHGPGELDVLIPSHSTITIDWHSRDDGTGELHSKRDIIADVVLGAQQATDLEFHLPEPRGQRLLTPVVLAQERGTGVEVGYELEQTEDGDRSVVMTSWLKGKPGRYVLLDMIVASSDPARRHDGVDGCAFVGPARPGAIPICCNLKPPGPNSPGSQPVLSNPPGGGGGAPQEPGGGSTTPQPNSSTSDGGNTCDANYGVVLPPSGSLTLRTTVRPLRRDEAEVALVGVFRNGHRVAIGDATLAAPSGTADTRRESTVWLTTPEPHVLTIEVPSGRTLRDTMRLVLPIDATGRRVWSIFARLPAAADCHGVRPFVVADLGNGLAFDIARASVLAGRSDVELTNGSGGWIALPGLGTDAAVVARKADGTTAPLSQPSIAVMSVQDREILVCFVDRTVVGVTA